MFGQERQEPHQRQMVDEWNYGFFFISLSLSKLYPFNIKNTFLKTEDGNQVIVLKSKTTFQGLQSNWVSYPPAALQ